MNDWQSTYLGGRLLPRYLSEFEIEAFFTFSEAEQRIGRQVVRGQPVPIPRRPALIIADPPSPGPTG